MSSDSSCSDKSNISGSDLEEKPLESISNVRRRRFLKNKKKPETESEEEATENTVQQETENDEYVVVVDTISSNNIIKKMLLSLLAVALLLLVLLIILFQWFEMGNAAQETTTDVSMGYYCSDRLKKLEHQMKAFEQATKTFQAKLAFLDEKTNKILEDSQLNNLDLKVSAVTPHPQASEHTIINYADDFQQLVDVVAKRVVVEELEKHEADGIGRKDHALASGGAFILRHSEAMFPINEHKHHPVSPEAINMLTPSFGEPGRCFSLKGSSGFVEIRLRTEIVPQSVTLEHVSSRVAYNMSSAPKDCAVSAWFMPNNSSSSSSVQEQHEVHKLVSFRYDVEKNKNRQTFEVERIISNNNNNNNVTEDDRIVNVVRFDVISNYGADHTCIYRLRVHGNEANASMEPKPSEICSNSATSNSVTNFLLLLLLVIIFLILGIAI